MITNQKEVLNFKEVVELLGISKSLLYKLTSSHKIPCLKPTKGKLFFKREQVLDWLINQGKTDNTTFNGNEPKGTNDGR